MNAGVLSVLGLSGLEEELYRDILRCPGTAAENLCELSDAPPHEVASALERLADLAVVVVGPDGRYWPESPESVVDSLADLRLRHLHAEMRAVTQARHLVASLEAEQEIAPAKKPVVEKIESLDTIRSRIEALAFFAREEIMSAEPYTALTHENIQHSRPLDLRCIRRGVRMRSVVLRQALEDAVTFGYLCELASKGAEIRVVEDMSARILVYDRSVALTPVDPADSARGALVAQEAGLVANVMDLFEKIWSDALELSVFCEETGECPEGPEVHLPQMEQLVLKAMCRGTKDEIGARDLGVSVRTYRRYVANILQLLEAASRPQAALLARERGWI
ncbi:helix-turn-helix transcriptional regulator [Streptomyces sp. JH34]|uniref:helix-turn-helix transcriptional regulator n=1 Tax=Streptomyces sp. JH34 TaxID=2793633 RepID=UPI0023F90095|nr:helix-turn-helix transcriptional regulator [Streptomyces sp. JH34]MDF6019136.1 helix-turn-helix transcriptional regulator [Streptomyces sp. JH34]